MKTENWKAEPKNSSQRHEPEQGRPVRYHTLAHAGRHTHLLVPPPHTMVVQSRVQTRACIWNQEWIHITCVVCCLSGSASSIMNRNIQPPQAGPWCLCTCKGFLKRRTDTQVCHSDAWPGRERQTQRRFPVPSHFLSGVLFFPPCFHLGQFLLRWTLVRHQKLVQEKKMNKKSYRYRAER